MPSQCDLRLIDEYFESESVDVSTISSSDVKTVKSVDHKGVFSIEEPKPVRKNSFGPPIIEDWHLDDESEEKISPTVEIQVSNVLGLEKSLTPHLKIGTSSRRSLGEDDASKQGRNLKQRSIFEERDFDVQAMMDADYEFAGRIVKIKRLLSAVEVTAAGYGFYSWGGLSRLKDFLVLLKLLLLVMVSTAVEYKNQKKINEMYYSRFTKVIIHHFMSKDPSIPRRNKINWHYVRDDSIFSTIKVVSRHQNTQQYGAMLPIELTNDEIRNTKAYKEFYTFATEEASPKPKVSARRKKSGSDTSITPPIATTTLTTTVAVTLKLTAAAKGKEPAKAKSINEGTGSKTGVPDVPTDESEEELSWNSSDDEGADDQ
nr:hypothetical protein [Tanacetum cinerariifolium]